MRTQNIGIRHQTVNTTSHKFIDFNFSIQDKNQSAFFYSGYFLNCSETLVKDKTFRDILLTISVA